jgi:hypothetical protein
MDDATLSTGRMPHPPAFLVRLPFARGLVKLAVSLAPLLSRKGTARGGERLFLVAALLAPLPLTAVPSAYPTAALAASILALVAWMLWGRTHRLHGAEHRAIAAAELRRLVATWHGLARPSVLAQEAWGGSPCVEFASLSRREPAVGLRLPSHRLSSEETVAAAPTSLRDAQGSPTRSARLPRPGELVKGCKEPSNG